jgi:hypothetical protein
MKPDGFPRQKTGLLSAAKIGKTKIRATRFLVQVAERNRQLCPLCVVLSKDTFLVDCPI